MPLDIPLGTETEGYTVTIDGRTYRPLKLDSQGRLLVVTASPALQSAVQVNRGSAQSIPASAWTKIQFDTEVFDGLGEWDNVSAYRFTAQAAGKYQVSGSIHMASIDANKSVAVWVYVNGAGGNYYADSGQRVATEDVYFPLAVLLNLAAGDYVELYVYHNCVAARNTGTSRCTFSIVRVQ